ncbi:RagB/SusD family nutrient uptake outer membrane protein [Massilibacteroides vaginae]|uniref:RagB/SusD family nutrient uptake outer membrane protein n=1 Tax=Massilibacteroides vaginae TaxID=1673718 RepID=UPI0015933C04|nr:RagB/SusD family nutrient uptake outer membrane protein [Massilibacteroides vaginae]
MKKIKFLIITFFSVLMLTSCDLSLDRFPETNLSDVNFWQNEANFRMACNQFQSLVNANDIIYDDNRSDYATGNVLNNISDGSRVVPSTSSDWSKPYEMIFTANKIIEKSNLVQFEGINRWQAEARFWRAYAYFQLVKKYGDVPLVLRVLDVKDPEFTDGRKDREVVIQQIYDDLDFSTENLPSFQQLGQTEYGRISKSASLALKSRVALYVGTHQKFHHWGESATHLQLSINASEAVMAEGHSLYNDMSYYHLFQLDGEGFTNKENILAIVYGQNLVNSIRSHNIGRELENGYASVTRAMIEQYLCTDGLPFDKSLLAEWPEKTPWSIFKNKDPRMQATIFTEGEPFGSPSSYIWNLPAIRTRFSPKKYSIVADWSSRQSFVDIALIRYAEILLNYAEAVFEKDNMISDDDLDKSINLLRDRVSMPRISNLFVSSNSLDMRTEIRRERSVELAQEGFRYDDIIRWKIAENVLSKRLIGVTFFEDIYTGSVNVTNDGYILVQDSSSRKFDPERDYLYPIPVRDISLSEGTIHQNPKW